MTGGYMSDKQNYQKHRAPRKPEKKAAPVLTPEEQAAVLAARVKAEAEAKAERERIELYGKSLPKLSHRQLQGELRRTIKREYAGKPPQPQAGLTILYATVLSEVLNNTKTIYYNRPDQINPNGRLHPYPL
jgi:regulator of protease activity HflC (stomatin/prohibitin superfamily)